MVNVVCLHYAETHFITTVNFLCSGTINESIVELSPVAYIAQCCTLLVKGVTQIFVTKPDKISISQKVISMSDSILPSN